ncbi:hypothetical protein [Flavobacterium sp. CAU 1735]|uniref:hypothetical protein n=1 Tax=Flavobacterium sp. CAU 1735 TaxID=3140361 RepID=UPI0032618ABB
MAKSYLNQNVPTLGLKNNNPGNIRRSKETWDGKVPFSLSRDLSFEQFYELRYGLRAVMRILVTYSKSGYSTISLMINRYAPASDNNDTNAYINYVSQKTGLKPDQPITKLTGTLLIELTKAIVKMEIGPSVANQYITDQDYRDGFNIIGLDLNSIVLPAPKKKLI